MVTEPRKRITGYVVTGLPTAMLSFLIAFTVGTSLADHSHSTQPSGGTVLSAEERAERFQPGGPWQGKGEYGLSEDEARAFIDYPLYWLGETFAGYHLQEIIRNKYTPPSDIPAHEAMDSVTFIYGECSIPDGGRACPVPIVIAIEPVCMKRPEGIAEAATNSSMETTRGQAELLRFRDGHVRLWTGQVSIYLDAPVDQALAKQMIEEFHGFTAEVNPREALPAPDFSGCAPVQIPPIQGVPWED